MQVFFLSRDAAGEPFRDLAVQRVRFVLRRMTSMVPRATVQLSDVNGPRGGVDKRCQVTFNTDRTGTVVVTSIGRDWRTALDNALTRANRVLLRLWRRGRPQRVPLRRAFDGET